MNWTVTRSPASRGRTRVSAATYVEPLGRPFVAWTYANAHVAGIAVEVVLGVGRDVVARSLAARRCLLMEEV